MNQSATTNCCVGLPLVSLQTSIFLIIASTSKLFKKRTNKKHKKTNKTNKKPTKKKTNQKNLQKINAQDSWKLMHNYFSPSLIFPLPLEGFWPCRNTLMIILLLGFTLTDFLWTHDASASISSADHSWNRYAICMWTYKCWLTWTQLVTNCDQKPDADSVRTPLTSAWRQCCTYITPTPGLSGPRCRNC